jgi:hypothetical protein
MPLGQFGPFDEVLMADGVLIGNDEPFTKLCDRMATCADLLEPIWQPMHRRVLQSRAIQTDHTRVRVQNPITGAMTTGRLWDYLGDLDHPSIVYDYTPDSAEGPERMLADFRAGYPESDAYARYDRIHARGILEPGCMAQARRKFDWAKRDERGREPRRGARRSVGHRSRAIWGSPVGPDRLF